MLRTLLYTSPLFLHSMPSQIQRYFTTDPRPGARSHNEEARQRHFDSWYACVSLIERNSLYLSSSFGLDSSRFTVSIGDEAAAYQEEGSRAAQAGVGTPAMEMLQKRVFVVTEIM
jgi:hypothetical protein